MDIQTGGFGGVLKAIFRWIANFLKILFFYRAYEISTLYHLHREASGIRGNELIDGIEYKILWKPYHLRKKLVTPMVWIRASQNHNFSKVTLLITAYNSKIEYQNCVTLYDISDIPTQSALPSIPFRDIEVKNNVVYTPYEMIKTKVLELYDSNEERITLHRSNEKNIAPFDNMAVALGWQKGDVELWGKIFNLEFIEDELREEQIRLIGASFSSFRPAYFIRKKLFSIKSVVKVVFWSKNIIFAKQLESKFIEYLKEHKTLQDAEKINFPP